MISEQARADLLRLYRTTIGYPQMPRLSPAEEEEQFGDFLGHWLSGRSRPGHGAQAPIIRYRIKQRWER